MSKLSTALMITITIVGFIGLLYMMFTFPTKPNPCWFYDGEGNIIPTDIVQLEVKSHFVRMTKAEKDSINRYFYLDTLK